jgi:hypothetical protein
VPPQWQAQAAAAWQPPVPPPHRDSSRTIAIIALVVSGLALLGVALTSIVPMLFFGLFASVAGEGFDDGTLFPSVSTGFGGQVSPAADGSVAGPTLATAVTDVIHDDTGEDLAGRVSCDPVSSVAGGVSVLCRAEDPTWYGIVRFTSPDGTFQITTVSTDGESFP